MSSLEIIGYPLVLIAVMELLLGFLLLTESRRRSSLHRSVAAIAFFSAAYSLNTAIMYLMAARGHDFNLFVRVNWIGWFVVPAGLQTLFYLRSETSRAARLTGYIVYPYWAIILALCLFTDLIVTSRYSLLPYENYPGPLEIPARMVGALMAGWFIVEIARVRRELTGTKKNQLNYFFCGSLIFSFAGVAIAGLMQALKGFAVEPGLGSYFSLPWVVLTFYAIVRHSLFEMRIIFSRMLAIIILIFACSVLQAALLTAIAPALGTVLSIFVSFSLLGFFLFGTPVSRKIQSLVDSVVIGNRYNYETLMREAIVTLNSKKEGPELIDYLIETTRAGLGVKDAGVYLHRVEDGFVLREGTGFFQAFKNQRFLADIAARKMRVTNQALVLAEMAGDNEDQETFDITAYLRGIGAEALVPLIFQGRLLGALILGKKVNGEMFGQSDVRFLETLAAHAASALENARLNDIARKIRSSLQESEERFMTLAQAIPAAVFVHRGASILYANAAAEEMSGYPSSRLTAMSFSDLLHPESRNYLHKISPSTGEPQTHQAGNEVRILQAMGTERWAVMTSAVIEYGAQAAVIAMLFDITEHKRNEGALRYDRIRAAVGRMASYLSAELERLVQALRHVAALEEYGEEGHSDPALAERIKSAVEQAKFLVRTVKEISAPQEPKRTMQDMNSLLMKRQAILAALLTGNCELGMRTSSESLIVSADPNRMESAFMHLVLHAQDRMQSGGIITIATDRVLLDADFIRRTGYGRIAMYALVSISHPGESMTAEEEERIFEPFFTTRDGAQGNGMGLSMAYDIIKEHEGYITATSRPGEGSSYNIYLPLEQGISRPRLVF